MSIKAIIIMFLVLITYFSIHFFVYFSVLKFFAVEKKEIKVLLGISLIILSLSFILAAIFVRFSDLFLFKTLYGIAAFWMGYVVIFSISLTMGWIIFLISIGLGIDFKIWIGVISFAVASVYAFWGVWNAFHPVTNEVEIGIKNLPSSWENKKIIQISDVHLGKINEKKFAQKLVEKINEIEPDILFITGDLFDGMGSNVGDFLPILEKIKTKQGIYFITENHEGYLGSAGIVDSLKKTNIIVLEDELVEIEGVQIIGLSYPEFHSFRNSDNIIEEIAGFDSKKTNILLYHVPMNIKQEEKDRARQHSQAYWKPDTDYSLAKNAGIDLQLSGHTHAGQFFPFTWIGKRIFNGFNYGLIADGDFNIYISSGTGTWGPPIRTVNKSEIVLLKLYNK